MSGQYLTLGIGTVLTTTPFFVVDVITMYLTKWIAVNIHVHLHSDTACFVSALRVFHQGETDGV